ncbi:YkgJ family cysteine cluster protein [Rhizobium ruizarguesonis]
MRAGHSVVRVNPPDGPRFIDSYARDHLGALTVQARSPKCPYLDSARRCSIHHHRPLVCRLYPLSLETLPDGTIAWLLHKNCNHVRQIIRSARLDELLREIRSTLESIAPILNDEIVSLYRRVDAVTERISEEDMHNVLVISKVH